MHGLADETRRDGDDGILALGADDFEIVLGEPITEPEDVLAKNAEDIAFVLAGFQGRIPRLGPRLPDVEVRTAAALLDAGRAVGAERVRVIGLGALRSLEDALPDLVAADLRPALEAALARVAGAAVVLPLGDALNESLSAPLAEILGDETDARLAEAVWERVTFGYMKDGGGLPDAFAELAWKSLHHALRFQIGFTLAGMPSHRDTAGAFVDLFERGNFPLGYMADGSFLVLTA